MKKVNGNAVHVPPPAVPLVVLAEGAGADPLLLAVSGLEWPPEKAEAFRQSAEGKRAARLLAEADRGEVDRAAAEARVGTCVADFDRLWAVLHLRGRQLSEAELAERQKPPPPTPPAAPPGTGYRPCRCGGAGVIKPGGARCPCTLVVGGNIGWELYALNGSGA
jgi:hypothetical protein